MVKNKHFNKINDNYYYLQNNFISKLLINNDQRKIEKKKLINICILFIIMSYAATCVIGEIYNRNMFEEVFKGQVDHTSSQVCVMIDVNEMKEINDNYGHPAGDHVLRNLGNILIKNIRQSDICIRYGGDEFFILFNKININDCQKIIDRIIKIINLKSIYIEDKQIHFSISYGIFQIEKGMPYDKSLVEVDKLLYECKKKNKSNQ